MGSSTTTENMSLNPSDEEVGPTDYVSPQEKFEPTSTAWYATTPVIKYLYRYVNFGCTGKTVMNELRLKDEDYDDEGGEQSVSCPSPLPAAALTFHSP